MPKYFSKIYVEYNNKFIMKFILIYLIKKIKKFFLIDYMIKNYFLTIGQDIKKDIIF